MIGMGLWTGALRIGYIGRRILGRHHGLGLGIQAIWMERHSPGENKGNGFLFGVTYG
jgi:hypothetical protein